MISQRQLKLNFERGVLNRLGTCSDEDRNFCCSYYHYGGNTGCDLCVSGQYIADADNSNMDKEWLDVNGIYSIELHKKWLNEGKKDDNSVSDTYDKEMIYQYIDNYVKGNLTSRLSADDEESGYYAIKQVLLKKVCDGVKNTFDIIFENVEILKYSSSFGHILETEMGKATGENCSFEITVDDVYQKFLLWFDLTEDGKECSKVMKYYHIHLRITDQMKLRRETATQEDDNLIDVLTEHMDKN
jgi:hypothetical protein